MGKFSADLFRIQPKAAEPTVVHKEQVGRVKPRRKGIEWFRISREVAIRLSKTSIVAWTVYICLMDLNYQAPVKNQSIKLTSQALKEWGISRGQKARALPELEAAGLIECRKHGRNNPVVRLLDV
jgi:hypothetical protein